MYKDLLLKHRDKFVMYNDMVFRKVKIGMALQEAHYVLFARCADLVSDTHKLLGHSSTTMVYDVLRKRYWWPDMRADVQDWLMACPECQLASNTGKQVHHAPMRPLDVPPSFSRWHLDFIGELPTTLNGNCWLLVAVD